MSRRGAVTALPPPTERRAARSAQRQAGAPMPAAAAASPRPGRAEMAPSCRASARPLRRAGPGRGGLGLSRLGRCPGPYSAPQARSPGGGARVERTQQTPGRKERLLEMEDFALREALLLRTLWEQTEAFLEKAPSGGTVKQQHKKKAAPGRCL